MLHMRGRLLEAGRPGARVRDRGRGKVRWWGGASGGEEFHEMRRGLDRRGSPPKKTYVRRLKICSLFDLTNH